jgi:ADP-ribose pyrophosphatase YjhB (NUDIX family)
MNSYKLPFKRTSARAIIVRRKDGALLGVLHNVGQKYAPPGGLIDDGETPGQALNRVLEEGHFLLIDSDVSWEKRLFVDFYQPEDQLDLYYILLVEDVRVGEHGEMREVRWLDQTQDVWSPQLREKMFLALKEYLPDMLNVDVSVLESW